MSLGIRLELKVFRFEIEIHASFYNFNLFDLKNMMCFMQKFLCDGLTSKSGNTGKTCKFSDFLFYLTKSMSTSVSPKKI